MKSGVDIVITGNLLRTGMLDAIFAFCRKKGMTTNPKAKYVLEKRFGQEFVVRKVRRYLVYIAPI